ncbi:MAG: hypothetical protein ACRCW9_05950 [Cetobacterium sp.]
MMELYQILFDGKKVFEGTKEEIIQKLQPYVYEAKILSSIAIVQKGIEISIESKDNPLGFNFITDLDWSYNKNCIITYMFELTKVKFDENELDLLKIAKELYKQCEEVLNEI